MGSAWGVSRFKRVCDCHSERKHYAKGLCRECYRTQPHFLAMRKRYYEANKSQWAKHGASARARRVRQVQLYGVSRDELDAMWAKQGGRCAICGEPPKRKQLAVDHCHATGRVRAFLCHRCNGGLGQFRDDPELLTRAVEYLRHHAGADSVHAASSATEDPRST